MISSNICFYDPDRFWLVAVEFRTWNFIEFLWFIALMDCNLLQHLHVSRFSGFLTQKSDEMSRLDSGVLTVHAFTKCWSAKLRRWHREWQTSTIWWIEISICRDLKVFFIFGRGFILIFVDLPFFEVLYYRIINPIFGVSMSHFHLKQHFFPLIRTWSYLWGFVYLQQRMHHDMRRQTIDTSSLGFCSNLENKGQQCVIAVWDDVEWLQ